MSFFCISAEELEDVRKRLDSVLKNRSEAQSLLTHDIIRSNPDSQILEGSVSSDSLLLTRRIGRSQTKWLEAELSESVGGQVHIYREKLNRKMYLVHATRVGGGWIV